MASVKFEAKFSIIGTEGGMKGLRRNKKAWESNCCESDSESLREVVKEFILPQ